MLGVQTKKFFYFLLASESTFKIIKLYLSLELKNKKKMTEVTKKLTFSAHCHCDELFLICKGMCPINLPVAN